MRRLQVTGDLEARRLRVTGDLGEKTTSNRGFR